MPTNRDTVPIDRDLIRVHAEHVAAHALATYLYLACLAGDDRCCLPAIKEISRHFGYSRNTVRKHLRFLVDYGLLKERPDLNRGVQTAFQIVPASHVSPPQPAARKTATLPERF